ncbi:apyrase [Venturia canescens]|uniref:apyrase n=1 Tax=Venturia canescens TaxID=32260 RepID=UPI001C9D0BCD|nr:apyrase-like [Venturia canescens]
MMNRRTPAIVIFLLIFEICDGRTARGEFYPGRPDLFELSIIHLNDFHARFEQVSPTAGTCPQDREEECVGGLPRVYTATKELKSQRPNAIFLNAGDHFQGTLWYNVYRWNVTATFMNMLPHDVMTIGNHEFDNGIAGVVPFLQNVKAPVVVTNIDASDEPTFQGLTKNSTIIVRDGRKIGVIGVVLSTFDEIASTEKLKFLDEVESVNLEAEKLKRNEAVDIIVVLSHCGIEVDKKMAENCPSVDVIVGGHSHTFLYSGPPPFIDTAEDEYPVEVRQKDTNRTVLIVQAAAYTKYLGNLTVWFDNDGEIVDWEGDPILLGQGIRQDPQILKALEPWKTAVDSIGKKEIGTTKVVLRNDCRKNECNLANFVTDAMVDAWMNEAENGSYWTYAAVACTNSGGLRTPIGNHVNDRVTYNDLITTMPFENTWDVLELQGRDIIALLLQSVGDEGSNLIPAAHSFLHWSGLKTTFDMSREPHERLVEAKIRCQKCDLPVYEKIDPDQWYRIVACSFLVQGGDGYDIFAENRRNHKVGMVDIDQIVDYFQRMNPVTKGNENRVRFKNVPEKNKIKP